MRVLVVEDDEALAATLRLGLEASGFRVVLARGVQEALEAVARTALDLAVVDVQLPDGSGFALVPRLRDRGLAVVVLTVRSAVADRVHGLELGADDYVVKPFAFEELVARLRAVARRGTPVPGREVLRFGDIALDLASQVATRAGHRLDLTGRELELLACFLRHPGRVLTYDQILDRVWGYDRDVGRGTLEVYVSYLRRKLEAHGPRVIHTRRGLGYVLGEGPG
jgi:two-component system response regulator MprA